MKKQNGFTMFEAIVVIGIIAIAAVIAFQFFVNGVLPQVVYG